MRSKASPPMIPKQRSLMVAKSVTQSDETIHEKNPRKAGAKEKKEFINVQLSGED